MRDTFRDKYCAITGASSGLGEALVNALRANGAKVCPVSRSAQAYFAVMGWDYIFLNAGIGWADSAAAPWSEEEDNVLVVDLLRPLRKAAEALHLNSTVHVHLTGSVQSLIPGVYHGVYAAAKHGLRGWAYAAARELPGRVSISYPNGMRGTEYFSSLGGDKAGEYLTRVRETYEEKDVPSAVASGILLGIAYGAREILPTTGTLAWARKNEVDIRRMWYPGLHQPSEQEWDWWSDLTGNHGDVSTKPEASQ